jgi:hypothetical protein
MYVSVMVAIARQVAREHPLPDLLNDDIGKD